jgi:hypothetical protein
MLFETANKKHMYFFPKYLNETVFDPLEYASNDTKRGGTVGNPATHFPAPRQRGDSFPLPTDDAFWASRQEANEVFTPREV